MNETVYPVIDESIARRRRELAIETRRAFSAFSRQVLAEGALPTKIKQLIAVAVAHVTQCPYCIDAHTQLAVKHGASDEEIMEAIWVAAEMRAGGAYAHSALALSAIEKARAHPDGSESSGERHAV